MAFVDPSILARLMLPDYLGSFDRGQQMRGQAMDRRALEQQRGRQQGFQGAFDQQAPQFDITTPEGQALLARALAGQGFGPEAFQMAQGIKRPEVQGPEFSQFTDSESPMLFDKKTGRVVNPGIKGKPQKEGSKRQFAPLPDAKSPTLYDVETGEIKNTGVAGKPAASTDPKPTQVFAQEQQLRTQFLGQTKDFRDVRDAYSRIQESAKDPSPAGDLALIFNYMKMLDPGSTVREGEFATAQNSGSIPDRIRASYNKALEGERLAPAQRLDFLSRAKGLYGKQEFQYKKTKDEYNRIIDQYPGLNRDRVLMDDTQAIEPDTASPPAKAGPKPGTVVDGFLFNGGDPNDQKNWKKVK